MIPFGILEVQTMTTIVRKAGIPSVKSVAKSMRVTGGIMSTPTMMSAEAVAAEGMEAKSGERNSERMNNTAVTTAVRPVRPPAMMLAEDSTKEVMVEEPRIEPTVVPTASLSSAWLQFGMVPSSLMMPDDSAQPMSVPTVLNMSSNRKVITMTTKSMVAEVEAKISSNAKLKKYGLVGRNDPPA